MRPTGDELERELEAQFRDAWPRIVRALAAFTGGLDDAEEYAAESVARAAAVRRTGRSIDSLAAWCISVGKHAWIDDTRRRAVEQRLAPELVATESGHPASGGIMQPYDSNGDHVNRFGGPDDPPDVGDPLAGDGLDDRLALLFVACDDALTPTSQLVLALRVVCGLTIPQIAGHLGIGETAAAARLTRAKRALAQARGGFRVPEVAERTSRLPIVIACVAGRFTVAHRTVLDPVDALSDTGGQSLSIANALVAAYPGDTEVRGLRAVIRLGLARRPGRVDETGTALALDQVDRSVWDRRLLAVGLADATAAAAGDGRFAIEAAISGLHSSALTFAETDWNRIVALYGALEQRWPSPSVRVARLAAAAHGIMAIGGGTGGLVAGGPPTRDALSRGELSRIERELREIEAGSAAYASRDAALTLADIAWRTERREEAAPLYGRLADTMTAEPLRRFCERRAAG